MQIAIVGAGIVGAATAHELALDGHDVTVFEQRSAAAEEASFANAGLLAPALLIPWAAPGLGSGLRRQLWGAQASLRMAGGTCRADLAWLWRWQQASRSATAPATLAALARLGQYSLERTRQISADMEMDAETSRGTLVLLRTPQDQEQLQPALHALREAGVVVNAVDADTARLIEPGLGAEVPLAGALHAPDGESGNCRLFAQMLRYAAQERGARFLFQSRVQSITGAPTSVRIAGEPVGQTHRFDAVIVCAGLATASLLRPLGLPLPVVALHGYSISAPLREESHAPQGAVVDPLHRVTITRQGQRVRVAGGAELGHGSAEHHAPTLQMLYHTLSGWFPGCAQLSSPQVQVWRGARPTLPDGGPVLGASGIPGVWVNAGHGAAGWAQACGSARVVADLLLQRAAAVDVQALSMQRF
ncbi:MULTISPECIES: FAD-dependent oxidoreductase [unclassified Acidovorax]|uniref:FAD-dependent oxidoreductase n=1 Tax=unclassified Acidovorax TaxID=2684926 RepID=UPI0028831D34|nr:MULTISPECIES: FAD-dependent oxidoreductase [unclassified Acidovorax]